MARSDDDILDGIDDEDPAGRPASQVMVEDEEQTLVTKEGLKLIKEELDHLKSVRRREVSQRLKEAISYGDLSENSEYEEAKNEQAFVEGRIIELERKVKNAKIITEKTGKKADTEVNIGSQVTIREVGEKDEESSTYTIVGATEANPFEHKISNESPVGKALLGHVKGETVIVHAPSGDQKIEILKVA